MQVKAVAVLVAFLALSAVSGCRKSLPFQPQPQPAYGAFSADYEETEDGLLIVRLWTDDYLLPDVQIMRSEAEAVDPVSIHYPTGNVKIVTKQRSEEVNRIVSIGAAREKREPARPQATFAVFRRAEIGDKPWRLRLRVPGQPNPLHITLTEKSEE